MADISRVRSVGAGMNDAIDSKQYGLSIDQMYEDILPAELYHHGVKGQHWGERRYQNSDGSLTPLGRLHWGVGAARTAVAERAEQLGTASKNAAKKAGSAVKEAIRPKTLDEKLERARAKQEKQSKKNELRMLRGKTAKIDKMTDEEIVARIQRLRNEQTLASLERDRSKSEGRRMLEEAVRSAGSRAVGEVVGGGIKKIGTNIVEAATKTEAQRTKEKFDIEQNKTNAVIQKQKRREAKDEAERYEQDKSSGYTARQEALDRRYKDVQKAYDIESKKKQLRELTMGKSKTSTERANESIEELRRKAVEDNDVKAAYKYRLYKSWGLVNNSNSSKKGNNNK